MRCISRREMIAATGALALLAACGRDEPRAARPRPIAIGVDECAWCRMVIDEERLAAQFVSADGRASSFGEAGCLIAWTAAHPDAAGVPFVRTLDAGDWRRAASARYATGVVKTPMRFDLTAHAAPLPDADRVATESWDEIRRRGAPHARQG
jgi:copper chaperone NosL